MLVALQAHSNKARRAVIISNRNFNRSAGGACGLAISAAVLQARLRATLPAEYAGLADSPYALPHFRDAVPGAVVDAYTAASHLVLVVQVPLIGLCFLGSLFVKDRGLAPIDEKQGVNTLRRADGSRGVSVLGVNEQGNLDHSQTEGQGSPYATR